LGEEIIERSGVYIRIFCVWAVYNMYLVFKTWVLFVGDVVPKRTWMVCNFSR